MQTHPESEMWPSVGLVPLSHVHQIWAHLAEPFPSYSAVTLFVTPHAARATRQANPLDDMGTVKNIID